MGQVPLGLVAEPLEVSVRARSTCCLFRPRMGSQTPLHTPAPSTRVGFLRADVIPPNLLRGSSLRILIDLGRPADRWQAWPPRCHPRNIPGHGGQERPCLLRSKPTFAGHT